MSRRQIDFALKDTLHYSRRKGAISLGCLMSLLIGAAVLYFGVPIAEIYLRANRFQDAMAMETQFHASHGDLQIKAHVAIIADSLGLPAEAGKIVITRKDRRLTLTSEYEELIHLPGYQRFVLFRPSASGSY